MESSKTMLPTKVEDFLEQNQPQTFGSTDVQKSIDLEIDPGNLFAYDVNEINLKTFRSVYHDTWVSLSIIQQLSFVQCFSVLHLLHSLG